MDQQFWPAGEPQPDGARTRKRAIKGALALLGAGAVAGGVLASTMSAGAATPAPSAPAAKAAPSTPPAGEFRPYGRPGDPAHFGAGHRFGLDKTGTVTAVGGSSVTIRSGTTTTRYAVGAASDIDKNGEAKLADLVVGDAVRFSVNGTMIDRLHAGTESLDRPTGGPGWPGRLHGGPGEWPPMGEFGGTSG